MKTPLLTAALLALVPLLSLSAEEKGEKKTEQKVVPKTIGKIESLDPAFDKLIAPGEKIEVLAGATKKGDTHEWVQPAATLENLPPGNAWSEGVVFIKKGYLLFSDIPPNRIMKWDPKTGSTTIYKEKVGYSGTEPFTGDEPGTNGLMLDAAGRLTMCCHGDRVIKRMDADGKLVVIADKYMGKRFNSPNDLIYHSNGDLYFTDPPYGLPKRENDPARELEWFGVYRLGKDGKITLLSKEMTRPNGIGLSPDEKTLYVAQSDPDAAIWKSFPVNADGTLGKSRVLYDGTKWAKEGRPGLPDGLAVDTAGHIWATGAGGIYCFSPEGKVLGRINTGERTANCKFGDDGSTLYLCADDYFCRVKTQVKGIGF